MLDAGGALWRLVEVAGGIVSDSLAGLDETVNVPSALVSTTVARRLVGLRVGSGEGEATIACVDRVEPATRVSDALRSGPTGVLTGRLPLWRHIALDLADVQHRGRHLDRVGVELVDVVVVFGSARVEIGRVVLRSVVGVDELAGWVGAGERFGLAVHDGCLVAHRRRVGRRVGVVVEPAPSGRAIEIGIPALWWRGRRIPLPGRLRRRGRIELELLPPGFDMVSIAVVAGAVEIVCVGRRVVIPVDVAA